MSKYSSKRSFKSKVKRKLKRPIKKAFVKVGRHSKPVKRLYKKIKVGRRYRIHRKHSHEPIAENLILFESFLGRKYSDSPRAIYEYMLQSEEYSDYEFIWFFKDRCMDDYLYLEENERTTLYLWGSPEYYAFYTRAKYWITNYRLPKMAPPREEQVYVQCWHGTPLKKLGYDIEIESGNGSIGNEARKNLYSEDVRRYSYMISPSRYCTEKFTSAFNLEGEGKGDVIIEEGYPRNDFIVNATSEDISRIKQNLGIPEDKKVILYAPTWRDNQHERGVGFVYESPIDFAQFHEKIGDDYVILFRAHYFIASKYNFDEFGGYVIDVCNYPEINDLYVISDMLITDYSSVFFDFGITRRPVIFYMYDLEFYRDELRGFYLSLDELPGPIVETQEDLEEKINTINTWTGTEEYSKEYEKFTNKFTYLDDGHATDRVVKEIFG